MRYDVEVSGFPSSHAGHLVLLGLDEDDYPNTSLIEQWPSWTLPVLEWARAQNGVVGYAHSGFGLQPMEPTADLPNYVMAKFDGVGANEYVVTVTHDAVDFISAGDTPIAWELNIWYHTLNAGFRTRISGETDFPCVYDDRVGMARTYAKLDGPLDFDAFAEATREGRSYVSDGRSHLMDFAVNGVAVGTDDSEVKLSGAQTVTVTAKVAAYLPPDQDESALPSRPVPWRSRPSGTSSAPASGPVDQCRWNWSSTARSSITSRLRRAARGPMCRSTCLSIALVGLRCACCTAPTRIRSSFSWTTPRSVHRGEAPSGAGWQLIGAGR